MKLFLECEIRYVSVYVYFKLVKVLFFMSPFHFSYRLFRNEREFKNGRCRTISGNFFANCINIFHKTEIQMVILMCLTSQNLNWFKSHDKKCALTLHAILAKSEIDHQNLHLVNGHFMTISGHFCANYMKIFDKNAIQTFILR